MIYKANVFEFTFNLRKTNHTIQDFVDSILRWGVPAASADFTFTQKKFSKFYLVDCSVVCIAGMNSYSQEYLVPFEKFKVGLKLSPGATLQPETQFFAVSGATGANVTTTSVFEPGFYCVKKTGNGYPFGLNDIGSVMSIFWGISEQSLIDSSFSVGEIIDLDLFVNCKFEYE